MIPITVLLSAYLGCRLYPDIDKRINLSMHPSALLILTTHVSSLCKGDTVSRIVTNVKKLVRSTLYVHLSNTDHGVIKNVTNDRTKPALKSLLTDDVQARNVVPNSFSSDTLSFVTKFYSEAALQCQHIDVNVLLHNIGVNGQLHCTKHILPRPVHCVLIDVPDPDVQPSKTTVRDFVLNRYELVRSPPEKIASEPPELHVLGLPDIKAEDEQDVPGSLVTKKPGVVLGGTFDQLHTGHKVLLSESILLASEKVVIGVSDGPLLQKKTLKELIQPFSVRKQVLEDFIRCVGRPGLELNIARIEDPYGPSITDPDLQIIAVSKETEKGGHMVNEERKKRGLSWLDVHIISDGQLLEDNETEIGLLPFEESKVSSSSLRFKLLGTLLKPCRSPVLDFLPRSTGGPNAYIIGLTGGIAAGKSSISKRLEKLGAVVIDCDKLGHVSYLPGSGAFQNIVESFGDDILASDGSIDRKKLGQIVFSDRQQLDKLNSIVWPEIERLCKEEIKSHVSKLEDDSGTPLTFVLDAAVLLEAGWDSFVHEVWVACVPEAEAIKRIVNRNKITEESAKSRITSQISNESRAEKANVLLSTLWEPSVTQSLTEKAWALLQARLAGSSRDDIPLQQEICHKL